MSEPVVQTVDLPGPEPDKKGHVQKYGAVTKVWQQTDEKLPFCIHLKASKKGIRFSSNDNPALGVPLKAEEVLTIKYNAAWQITPIWAIAEEGAKLEVWATSGHEKADVKFDHGGKIEGPIPEPKLLWHVAAPVDTESDPRIMQLKEEITDMDENLRQTLRERDEAMREIESLRKQLQAPKQTTVPPSPKDPTVERLNAELEDLRAKHESCSNPRYVTALEAVFAAAYAVKNPPDALTAAMKRAEETA